MQSWFQNYNLLLLNLKFISYFSRSSRPKTHNGLIPPSSAGMAEAHKVCVCVGVMASLPCRKVSLISGLCDGVSGQAPAQAIVPLPGPE